MRSGAWGFGGALAASSVVWDVEWAEDNSPFPRRRVGRMTALASSQTRRDNDPENGPWLTLPRATAMGTVVEGLEEDGEEEDAGRKGTDAPPAGPVPADGTQVGTTRAAGEVAEHVNHVEPAAG